ncbi:sulfite exporter TauE/SafE family protein [Gymnodinialimonas sp. 57CJ19]|uniref:sulfite exporter TauE/SafE family protein n=1 Tax=Gymnodinialimonas sp. 57CJ19 TaxID=3138498 RepID=UPI0031342B20
MDLTQSIPSLVIANCVVVLAAVVQTSTGMGFGMIAAPMLALVSFEYVPGPMLFINLFLSLLMLGDGRAHVVRAEVKVLLPMILAGTMLGAAILLLVPADTLGILFSVLVLVTVAITIFARALALTPRNLGICGAAAGLMGTTTGIPGAPLVVLYQHEPLSKTRPTMAVVFTFSYVVSLIALAVAGMFSVGLALLGLLLLPGLAVGFWIGKRVRGYLSARIGRILMLSIASAGAVLLLMRSI